MSRLSCTVRLVRFVCDCRFERGSLCSCPQAEAIEGSSFWESTPSCTSAHGAVDRGHSVQEALLPSMQGPPRWDPLAKIQHKLHMTNSLPCLAHAPQDSKSRTIELCTRARPTGALRV